jgi:hypothetical protein
MEGTMHGIRFNPLANDRMRVPKASVNAEISMKPALVAAKLESLREKSEK